MLIWDQPELVNAWVASKGGGLCWPGSFSALGWEENGELIAGLVFYDCNGTQCLVNVAVKSGRLPSGLLKAALRYVFKQLKLKRLTFIVEEGNLASQNISRHLGAHLEATLQGAGKTGNMLIFALFPENCKIWSRING